LQAAGRKGPDVSIRSSLQAGALIVLLAAVGAGCRSALPEQGSADEQLYSLRCGGCHPPYEPGIMKPAMWGIMVARMESELKRRGLPRLADEEREKIIAYLSRHAAD